MYFQQIDQARSLSKTTDSKEAIDDDGSFFIVNQDAGGSLRENPKLRYSPGQKVFYPVVFFPTGSRSELAEGLRTCLSKHTKEQAVLRICLPQGTNE